MTHAMGLDKVTKEFHQPFSNFLNEICLNRCLYVLEALVVSHYLTWTKFCPSCAPKKDYTAQNDFAILI